MDEDHQVTAGFFYLRLLCDGLKPALVLVFCRRAVRSFLSLFTSYLTCSRSTRPPIKFLSPALRSGARYSEDVWVS